MRPIVELFIRWIHLIAAIVWFSGVLFSAIIAPPILRRHSSLVESLKHTAAIRGRLRSIIRVAIHVLLITGAMIFFIIGWDTRMTFSPNYVVVFGLKMGFVGLMAVFHALHFWVFGHRLEVAIAEVKSDDSGATPSIAKVQRQTRLFAILTLCSGLAAFGCALHLHRIIGAQ